MRFQSFMMVVALAGCAIEPDDIETGETESLASVQQWTPGQSIEPHQSSFYQPGLVEFNGKVHMVHNGYGSDRAQLWYSTFDGRGWTPNTKLAQVATGGPSLVGYAGWLKMIYRLENRLMMTTWNGSSGATAFSGDVTIGSSLGYEQLHGEPAAATLNGELYVGYCTDKAMRVDKLVGDSWTLMYRKPMTGGYACEHVELAAIIDPNPLYWFENLHLFFTTTHDRESNQRMYEVRSSDGAIWKAVKIAKESTQPISIVTCNGITHMTHGGTGYGGSGAQDIVWSEKIGYGWPYDYKVANRWTSGGAALACMGNRTLMVWPSHVASDRLTVSEFGP